MGPTTCCAIEIDSIKQMVRCLTFCRMNRITGADAAVEGDLRRAAERGYTVQVTEPMENHFDGIVI